MAKYNNDSPCYRCADRTINCHSGCAAYRTWKDDRYDQRKQAEEISCRNYNEYIRIRNSRISRAEQRLNRIE